MRAPTSVQGDRLDSNPPTRLPVRKIRARAEVDDVGIPKELSVSVDSATVGVDADVTWGRKRK